MVITEHTSKEIFQKLFNLGSTRLHEKRITHCREGDHLLEGVCQRMGHFQVQAALKTDGDKDRIDSVIKLIMDSKVHKKGWPCFKEPEARRPP